MVSAAVTKLVHDSFAVLHGLREKISRIQNPEKRKKDARGIAGEDEMPKKKAALERFGRDLTVLAGTLPDTGQAAAGRQVDTLRARILRHHFEAKQLGFFGL